MNNKKLPPAILYCAVFWPLRLHYRFGSPGLFHSHFLKALYKVTGERSVPFYATYSLHGMNPDHGELIGQCIPSGNLIKVEDPKSEFPNIINKLLTNHNKLVVHALGTGYLPTIKRLKKKYPERIKLVMTTHSFMHRNKVKRFFASFIQYHMYNKIADFIIFQTPATADMFLGSRNLFLKGKAGIIPLGMEPIDLKSYVPSPTDPDIRLQHILSNGKRTFVMVAYFKKGKQQDFVIRTLLPVLRMNPQTQLLFIGDGDLLEYNRRIVKNENMAEQIHLPGKVHREWVPWVLSKCAGAIAISTSETFGFNIFDPMFMGLPVIGISSGIGKSILLDYFTGFRVCQNDRQSLQRAFTYLIQHPKEAEEMGKNAQRLVSAWTWDEIAKSHFRVYDNLVV